MDQRWLHLLLALLNLITASAKVHVTTPGEGQYKITIEISDNSQCVPQNYLSLCSSIAALQYKQCEVLSAPCQRSTDLLVTFNEYKVLDDAELTRTTLQMYRGLRLVNKKVADVDECLNNQHVCSKNGYCTNIFGGYRCQCGYGYEDAQGMLTSPGTFCVARCNQRSCRNDGVCFSAADESSDVTCECREGFTGSGCEDVTEVDSLPQWAVILIAVTAGVAAVVGLGLCGYASYRLYCRHTLDDGSDVNSSIYTFKPRAIPNLEYDRMTDLGSISRSNRGFASIIDEESLNGTVKADALKFGTKLMSSTLSVPSEHGDPTPALNPSAAGAEANPNDNLDLIREENVADVDRFSPTDRHAAADISQPDYY